MSPDGDGVPDGPSPDRIAIEARIRGMYESFSGGDIAGIDACLADGATVWDVFVPDLIHGPEQLARFHAQDRAQALRRGRLTLRVHEMVIDVWGGVACARYRVEFAYQPPYPLAGTVRVTDVLIRGAGEWVIAHHHEGLTPTGA